MEEAEVLDFEGRIPGLDYKPAVERRDVLKAKTGPFGPSPSPSAWLRKCPSCGQTTGITRKRLYDRADEAEARGEDTVVLIP